MNIEKSTHEEPPVFTNTFLSARVYNVDYKENGPYSGNDIHKEEEEEGRG